MTHPARLKLALSLLAAYFGARLLVMVFNIPSHLIPDLHIQADFVYILITATTRVLVWFSVIFVLLAMHHIRKLCVLTAIRQRIAAIAIQLISLWFTAHYGMWAVLGIESFVRHTIAPNLYLRMDNWVYNNDWISTVDSYFTQLWWISWLVLLCPPSLSLLRWVPKRERACRIIGFSLIGASLVFPVSYYIHRLNPFDFTNDPYSRIETFLRHMRISAQWCYPLATLAAFVFLMHLRKHAHQLLPSPNHCPTCAYPLDPSIHTCPECGLERAIITMPTQPVQRNHTTK